MQALLAMDSYHRDGDGLSVSGSVGNAELVAPPERMGAFFATAYSYKGPIVISYRGTDNPVPFTLDNDVSSGWVAGAGWSRATQVGQ